MNANKRSVLSTNHNDDNNAKSSLLLGLGSDDVDANQLADAFWEIVWPKLQDIGWEKKIVSAVDRKKDTTIFATKKDLDLTTSREGKDYFKSIKDVIERINLRQNAIEATLADKYQREISKRNYRSNLSPMSRSRNTLNIDLSWKDGRKYFPKKSSMIGENYQVSFLPTAGSYQKLKDSCQCEVIWDSKKAIEKGINMENGSDILSEFPSNLREAALVELSRHDYNVDLLKFGNTTSSLKPSDGSDWSKEQKAKFHADIFRYRRNLPAVARSMNVPIKYCHAYYLGTYKSTPEYFLLKSICIDERHGNTRASKPTFDVCAICGDGGNLIICDGCEGEYHMNCLKPPLRVVPEGHWMCDDCVNTKALEARDKILEKSTLFEMLSSDVTKMKKRSFHELTSDSTEPIAVSVLEDGSKVEYRPSEPFRDALVTFSSKINNILRKRMK